MAALAADAFLARTAEASRSRAPTSFAAWLFLRLAVDARAREPARAELGGTTLGYLQLAGEPFVSTASVLFH